MSLVRDWRMSYEMGDDWKESSPWNELSPPPPLLPIIPSFSHCRMKKIQANKKKLKAQEDEENAQRVSRSLSPFHTLSRSLWRAREHVEWGGCYPFLDVRFRWLEMNRDCSKMREFLFSDWAFFCVSHSSGREECYVRRGKEKGRAAVWSSSPSLIYRCLRP